VLDKIKSTTDLSWEGISKVVSFFDGIPAGTLHYIHRTGRVPRKWRRRLGISDIRDHRLAISKTDVESAANTMLNNLDHSFLQDLVVYIWAVLRERDNE
jgi:hypothetical protein